MAPYWDSLYAHCLYPALTYLDMRNKTDPAMRTEFALVTFCDHMPYGDRLLRVNHFTNKLAVFNSWAKAVPFQGGGYAQNAVTEGLYSALELFDWREGRTVERYLLLATNSRQHDMPCSLHGSDASELSDLVRMIVQKGIFLSCFLPHSLDPLRSAIKKVWEMCKPQRADPNIPLKDLPLASLDHVAMLTGINLSISTNGEHPFLIHPPSATPSQPTPPAAAPPAAAAAAAAATPPARPGAPAQPGLAAGQVGMKRDREEPPAAAKPGMPAQGPPQKRPAPSPQPPTQNVLPGAAQVQPAGQPSAQAPQQAQRPGMMMQPGQAARPGQVLPGAAAQAQQAPGQQPRQAPQQPSPQAQQQKPHPAQPGMYQQRPGAQQPGHPPPGSSPAAGQQHPQRASPSPAHGMSPSGMPQGTGPQRGMPPGGQHPLAGQQQASQRGVPQPGAAQAQLQRQGSAGGAQGRQMPLHGQMAGQHGGPPHAATAQPGGQPQLQRQSSAGAQPQPGGPGGRGGGRGMPPGQGGQPSMGGVTGNPGAPSPGQQPGAPPPLQRQSSTGSQPGASGGGSQTGTAQIFQTVLWKGEFITQKDGKSEAFCSALGCAALHPNAPASTKNDIQQMIHRLFQNPEDRMKAMEIKKFEDAAKLPELTNVCLCFMEQQAPDGGANDKFRKLHLSLTKHNKFAYIVAQTSVGPKVFALTPDGNPKSHNTRDWRLLGILVPQRRQAPPGSQPGGQPGQPGQTAPQGAPGGPPQQPGAPPQQRPYQGGPGPGPGGAPQQQHPGQMPPHMMPKGRGGQMQQPPPKGGGRGGRGR